MKYHRNKKYNLEKNKKLHINENYILNNIRYKLFNISINLNDKNLEDIKKYSKSNNYFKENIINNLINNSYYYEKKKQIYICKNINLYSCQYFLVLKQLIFLNQNINLFRQLRYPEQARDSMVLLLLCDESELRYKIYG